MSDEESAGTSLQVTDHRVGLLKKWSLEFKSRFNKIENALVVSRTIAGNTGNLKRRAAAADRYIEQLRKVVDGGGDVTAMHRYLSKLSKEMYQLRNGLRETTAQCQELKKYLNMDVNLEKYWHDAEKEDIG